MGTHLSAIIFTALISTALTSTPASGQPPPEDFDEGLFDLRISRDLSGAVLILQNPRGEILVPLLPVLALTEIPYSADDPARLHVMRQDSEVIIDAASGRVESMHEVIELDQDRLVRAYDDFYVPGSVIADMLDADVEVDFGALTIRMSRDPPFPAELRLQRERERTRAERVAGRVLGERDVPLSSVRYRPLTGLGTLDWGATFSGTDGLPSSGSIRGRLGMALWGGEVSMSGRLGISGTRGVQPIWEGISSYRRVFPENRWVQQIQLGDVTTQGVRSRSVLGAHITNVPVVRDRRFDEVVLQPDLPEGWEYEVYQGGILVGASGPDAEEGLRVPLAYGSTPLRIRYLGPMGEERSVEFTHYVPVGQLPAGNTEYGLGGGMCRTAQCDWLGAGDLRHGFTNRLTAGGGVEIEADTLGDRGVRTYGLVSVLPFRNLMIQSRVMPGGFARGSFRYSPTPRSRLTGEGGVERPGFRSGSLLPEGTDRWFGRLEGSSPLPEHFGPFRSMRGSLRAEGRIENSGPTRLRAAVGGGIRGGYLEIWHDRSEFIEESVTAIRGTTTALSRRPGLRSFRPVVSAVVGLSRSGFAHLEGSGSVAIRESTGLRGSAGWTREGGTRLSLGLNTTTGSARLRAGVTSGTNSRTTASAAGVLSYGPQSGIHADTRHGGGHAGVEGRVFHDRSGDGVFGSEDEAVANVPVVVAGRRVTTDGEGRYRVWGLRPYEVTAVAVDSLRIPDPTWAPARPTELIRPVPNVYSRIDIPLTRTRELIGRLVAGEDVPTPSGVTLLVMTPEGEEVIRAQTFFGGDYYISRVRAGRYELHIADSSLGALRATATPHPLEFVVPAEGDDPMVELPDVILVHRDES